MMAIAPGTGLPLALAIRIGCVALTVAAFRHPSVARRIAFIGSAIASTVTGVTAAAILYSGATLHGVLLVQRASAFSFPYSIAGLAAWFLLVLSVVGGPIAVFSLGYVAHHPFHHRSVFIGTTFQVLLGTVELLFVAADAVTFLFAWELMTLVNAALVATEHEARA